jgi:tripartite-type tricarboxylate transporter receptor subunit TctC
MKRRALLGAFTVASIGGTSSVYAQSTRPLTIVVPYAAGGGGDTVARLVAKALAEQLGRSVIVDNRPGANGVVAVQALLRGDTDGSMLLLTDSSILSINPRIYKQNKFDPKKDIDKVSLIARGPLFLAVHPKLGINKFSEFIMKIKSNPGRYNYGTPGAGSTHHLSMEYLKHSLGLNIQHAPFKGASPAVSALVSGEVEMAFAALPSIQGFAQANKVKIIAVNSTDRYVRMPDVPAISETVAEFDFASNVGLVCARGVPKDIIESLSTSIVKTIKSKQIAEAFAVLGVEPVGLPSSEYKKQFLSEDARIEKAVYLTQLQVD